MASEPSSTQKPLFISAQGSLVTALAHPTLKSDARTACLSWREVDFALVHIDPTLEPGNPFTNPEAIRYSYRGISHKDLDEKGSVGMRHIRGRKPSSSLSVDPPAKLFTEVTTFPTPEKNKYGAAEVDDVRKHESMNPSPLWHSQVVAHFEHGKTLYDVTDTSLRTQLEQLALKANLAPYNLLLSPVFIVTNESFEPLFSELREKILPSLVTSSAIRNAFFGATGIVTNDASLLKKNRQVEGRNVSAENHNPSDTKIIFSRAKHFCLATWTALRGNLFTLPSASLSRTPAANTLEAHEKHWRQYFTLDGLLELTAAEAPDVFDLDIDGIVSFSKELSPVGIPLCREEIQQAARDLAKGAAEIADGVFPFLLFIRKVVAVRKARGVVSPATGEGEEDSPALPPLYCDLFLVASMKAFSRKLDKHLDIAVANGLVRNLEEVPDEDLFAMNSFLEKAALLASSSTQ